MKIILNLGRKSYSSEEIIILSAFSKNDGTALNNSHWPKVLQEAFKNVNASKGYSGKANEAIYFTSPCGATILSYGLGEKSKVTLESLRKSVGKAFKLISNQFKTASIDLDGFISKSKLEESTQAVAESLYLTAYTFDKHFSKKKKPVLTQVFLDSTQKKTKQSKLSKVLTETEIITSAINESRDFVNEPPNILDSVEYSKRVQKEMKGIKGVKVKVLGKSEMKKEKMGLFLSVNAGSAFEPQLVHLTYTPSKSNSKTKHVALVGKGLTFDTGGYSLKPSASIINMKFDMAGSATVYGAFKALAKLKPNCKITCILGMTDNAISSKATLPDAIIAGRNGKTVEILNTDAEGRLVLADCLDYACDLKPDSIIDCATLTGACLVSLGSEVCGVMGNNQKLVDSLLKSSKNVDEYMWQLPIIEEYRADMKSNIADLKNIGSSRFGGTAKAAAFLEEFIKDDINWAHLDIAGIGDSQSHLPYCPTKGGSGLIIRTLIDYVKNA